MNHLYQPLYNHGVWACEDLTEKRTPVLLTNTSDQGGGNYKMCVGGLSPYVSTSHVKFATSMATSIEFNLDGYWPNGNSDYSMTIYVNGVSVASWSSEAEDGADDPKSFSHTHTASLTRTPCGNTISVTVTKSVVGTTAIYTDLEVIIT